MQAHNECGGDVVLDGLRMADGGRKGEKKVGVVWLGWAGVISGGVRCCLLCGRWTLDLDPLQRRAGSACGPGGGNGVFSANGVPGWLVRRQVLPLLAVGGSAMARLGCGTTHGSRPWGGRFRDFALETAGDGSIRGNGMLRDVTGDAFQRFSMRSPVFCSFAADFRAV